MYYRQYKKGLFCIRLYLFNAAGELLGQFVGPDHDDVDRQADEWIRSQQTVNA